MSYDVARLDTPSGATINLYVALSADPRGVLQVNHGISEHAGRYERFAMFMARQGFHVYVHDHRGHGLTRAPDAAPGHFAARNGAEVVLSDVAAIHALITSNHPGLPVIVFGHSMGGLIALNHALRNSVELAGVAIWNSNFAGGLAGRAARAALAWEKFRLGSDVPSRILPRMTFQAWARQLADPQTPFDWLSRDPDEVAAYVADPDCGRDPTVGTWQAVFDFIFFGADDRNFASMRKDMPVYLVGGEHDPATEGGRAVTALATRMEWMGFSNLVSRIYPDTRHESLNELNRDVIMRDFAGWARQIVK